MVLYAEGFYITVQNNTHHFQVNCLLECCSSYTTVFQATNFSILIVVDIIFILLICVLKDSCSSYTVVSWKSTHSRKSSIHYIWPNFLYRVKFTWTHTHPRARFVWVLRSTASSTMHIWGKKILHQRQLCVDGCRQCGAHRELHYFINGDMVPFRVLCGARTQLWSHWWFHCRLCLSNYLLRGHWPWRGRSFVIKCRNTRKSPHPPSAVSNGKELYNTNSPRLARRPSSELFAYMCHMLQLLLFEDGV